MALMAGWSQTKFTAAQTKEKEVNLFFFICVTPLGHNIQALIKRFKILLLQTPVDYLQI